MCKTNKDYIFYFIVCPGTSFITKWSYFYSTNWGKRGAKHTHIHPQLGLPGLTVRCVCLCYEKELMSEYKLVSVSRRKRKETQMMVDGDLKHKKNPLNLYFKKVKVAMCELNILFVPPEPHFSKFLHAALYEGNCMHCISLINQSLTLQLTTALANWKQHQESTDGRRVNWVFIPSTFVKLLWVGIGCIWQSQLWSQKGEYDLDNKRNSNVQCFSHPSTILSFHIVALKQHENNTDVSIAEKNFLFPININKNYSRILAYFLYSTSITVLNKYKENWWT